MPIATSPIEHRLHRMFAGLLRDRLNFGGINSALTYPKRCGRANYVPVRGGMLLGPRKGKQGLSSEDAGEGATVL